MTHFLDKLPYDFVDPAAINLWNTLADNYLSKNDVVLLVRQATLSPADVNWDQTMKWVWHDILDLARRRDKLRALIAAILGSADAGIATAVKELIADQPLTAPPPPDQAGGIAWQGGDDAAADERIIGSDPTFLDVSFLRRGLEISPAVCKLVMTFDQRYLGTGFVIGPDLLLTNHHNLFDHDHADVPATKVEAHFGYERSFAGLDAEPTVVEGDVDSMLGDREHDWAVIRLASPMPAGIVPVTLTGAPPPRVDDRVYVIQHPGGQPKKIGMVHNVVKAVQTDLIQYLTDTDGGSSGSPVFNERWELVALHHRWVSLTVAGRLQYRNQGRRIERVVAGLRAARVIP